MAVPCATTSNASVNPMLTFQFQFLFSCFIPNVKRNEMILSRYHFLKLYILFSVNKLYHVTKKKKKYISLSCILNSFRTTPTAKPINAKKQ